MVKNTDPLQKKGSVSFFNTRFPVGPSHPQPLQIKGLSQKPFKFERGFTMSSVFRFMNHPSPCRMGNPEALGLSRGFANPWRSGLCPFSTRRPFLAPKGRCPPSGGSSFGPAPWRHSPGSSPPRAFRQKNRFPSLHPPYPACPGAPNVSQYSRQRHAIASLLKKAKRHLWYHKRVPSPKKA